MRGRNQGKRIAIRGGSFCWDRRSQGELAGHGSGEGRRSFHRLIANGYAVLERILNRFVRSKVKESCYSP